MEKTEKHKNYALLISVYDKQADCYRYPCPFMMDSKDDDLQRPSMPVAANKYFRQLVNGMDFEFTTAPEDYKAVATCVIDLDTNEVIESKPILSVPLSSFRCEEMKTILTNYKQYLADQQAKNSNKGDK